MGFLIGLIIVGVVFLLVGLYFLYTESDTHHTVVATRPEQNLGRRFDDDLRDKFDSESA